MLTTTEDMRTQSTVTEREIAVKRTIMNSKLQFDTIILKYIEILSIRIKYAYTMPKRIHIGEYEK
jgi:hypothetical protein